MTNHWLAVTALLVVVGCGGGKAAPTPAAAPAPAPAPAATADPASTAPAPAAEADGPETCDDACTEIAVCYEEIYGGDYRGGGACVDSCEERTDTDRAAYFACIGRTTDCEAMMNDC